MCVFVSACIGHTLAIVDERVRYNRNPVLIIDLNCEAANVAHRNAGHNNVSSSRLVFSE